jgi:hypothetical protein
VVECEIDGIGDNDLVSVDLSAGVMTVPARGIERRFAPLPHAMQSLLAAGGLIPFLQEHPDWDLAGSR